MKYVSWFSGVGGFDLALNRAGHERVGACEIDDHARRVYEARLGRPAWFPNDIMEVKADDIPEADIWCGGSPCQGFSVAGKRGGLEDDRSGLLRRWLDLAAERRPKWFWMENVPGILSVHGGRDFGELLARLDDIGFRSAWATLDARWFRVAQRRRRVFIVGHIGAGGDPASVRFESEGRSGNSPPGAAARTRSAPRSAVGAGDVGVEVAGTLGGGSGKRGYPDDLDRSGAFIPMGDPQATTRGGDPVSNALNAHGSRRYDGESETFVAEAVSPALRTNPYNNSDPGMESKMLVGAPVVPPPPDGALDGQIGLFDDVEAIQCHGGNVGPMGALRRGNGNTSGGVPVAFTQNQREEVRLVGGDGDGVGALSSQPGSHQQTFVKVDEVASPLTASAGHHGHSSPRGDGRDNLVVGALTARYSTGTASHPNRTRRGDGLVIDKEPQVVQGDSAASTPDLPSLRAGCGRAGENAVLLDDAEPTYCIEDPGRKESGGPEVGLGVSEEVAYTLQAGSKHAVAAPPREPMAVGENQAGGPSVRLMHQTSALSGAGGKPGQGYQAVLMPPEVTAFSSKDSGGDATSDLSPTLRSGVHKDSHANGGVPPAVSGGAANAGVVRRLTPTECERLQGFPDGWSCLCGADPYSTSACRCPDSPRYKALGNAVAVPVCSWIAVRLARAEAKIRI
jgi:DNA (cytosine-5)-methyltransferase 1